MTLCQRDRKERRLSPRVVLKGAPENKNIIDAQSMPAMAQHHLKTDITKRVPYTPKGHNAPKQRVLDRQIVDTEGKRLGA